MHRRWSFLIITGAAALLTFTQAPPAAALDRSEPPSRADHIAAQLRRDPVYVTDHAPRVVPPDAAARIKASVARLGVPTYVAVTPTVGLGEPEPHQPLIPLLHDRLRRNGVYIVVSPTSGLSEARQFGGGRRLPVTEAWRAAEMELPSDAGAPVLVERFVEIVLSGRAHERYRNPPSPRPKTKLRKALDADDAADRRAERLERAAFGGGAALSGIPLLAGLTYYRVRRRRSTGGTKKKKKKQTTTTTKQTNKAKGGS